MGTGLTEKSAKISKKVSFYSYLLVPAIIVGLGLLGYQTYSLFTGKSFKEINFEIGKLWKTENVNVDAPIEEEDLIIEVISEVQNLAKVTPPQPIKVKEPKPATLPAKQVHIVKPQMVANKSLGAEFHPIELEGIHQIEIPIQTNNALMQKYVEQVNNDFLIDPDLQGEKGKWYFGVSFAPSLNYRTFSYSSDISGVVVTPNTRYIYGMTESYRDQTDRAVSAYYSGVDVGFNIGNRLDIATGLYYSIYGETISVSRVSDHDLNAQSASYYSQTPLYNSPEDTETPSTIAYNNTFSYVEIPITATFLVMEKNKADISIQAGVYGQMLDHANALVYDFETDYYYWMNRTDYEIYRKYGFGVTGGVQLSQFIGNRLEVFVNPQFKFNVTSTFQNPYPVQQKQYATGLRLGFRQHFNP
ncbi:PorT family protein [bacterium]|nr:PorT family protein [bacterium]